MAVNNQLSILLTGFITLIVAMAFISPIANITEGNDVIDTVSHASVTTSSNVAQLTDTDITALTFFGNATNNTGLSSFTIGTDANLTRAGVLSVSGDFADGDYNISYTHEGEYYIADSTSRTLSNLIILFFVLAILGVGIFIAYRTYPEMFNGFK